MFSRLKNSLWIALPVLLLLQTFAFSDNLLIGQTMKLPTPKTKGKITLEQSLDERRSQRDYSTDDVDWTTLSQLLWAGQGITENTWGFRTAPSAGGIFPLTIYICRPEGLYEYIPQGHQVKLIAEEDRRLALSQASLAQNFIAQAPVCLIITADSKKVRPKYGGRADRYIYLEAGHAAENILLQSTALGLSSCPVGAFWDDIAKRVLSLPDNEDPIYLIPIGYPK